MVSISGNLPSLPTFLFIACKTNTHTLVSSRFRDHQVEGREEVADVLLDASNSMGDGGDNRRSRGRRVMSHPPRPLCTPEHAAHVKARSQHAHVPLRFFLSPLWRKTQEEIDIYFCSWDKVDPIPVLLLC